MSPQLISTDSKHSADGGNTKESPDGQSHSPDRSIPAVVVESGGEKPDPTDSSITCFYFRLICLHV